MTFAFLSLNKTRRNSLTQIIEYVCKHTFQFPKIYYIKTPQSEKYFLISCSVTVLCTNMDFQ